MLKTTLFTVYLLVALSIQPSLNAATIYVDSSPSGAGNDGTTWADAYSDLQDALSASTAGDQIWVAAGIYTPGSLRTDTFQLKTGVAIYGGFLGTETSLDQRDSANNLTTLSGDLADDDTNGGDNSENSYHVLVGSGTNATALLDGFTIIAGNADGLPENEENHGGGLYNNMGSPSLSNCIFSGNSAKNGGAISNRISSSPTLLNCLFLNNSATTDGGAIRNFNSSSPTFMNCEFTENSANYGGAILNVSSSAPTLTNSVFTDNSATFGGAILNNASSPMLTNCSLSGNSGSTNGGAIYNTSTSSPALANCIIWNNTASGVPTTPAASVNNNGMAPAPTYSYCLIANINPTGTGNLDGTDSNNDPLFVSSTDLRLQVNSPGIDAGSQTAYITEGGSSSDLDLAGNSRFVDDLVTANPATEPTSYLDLGAYEANDLNAPSIQSFTLTTAETTGATTLEFALIFDENVYNLDSADDLNISTTGTAAYSGVTITGSGSSYTITLTGITGGGDFGIALKTDTGVTDRWSNAISANTGIENVSRISTHHYVNAHNATPAAPYDTWATAAINPQDVLALAASGDQIWVAQGIYTPDPGSAPTLGDRSATFQLLSGVALYGGFSGTETSLDQRNPDIYLTILSGDLDSNDNNGANITENSYHVVTGSATDATALLDGFTITAGNANGAAPHHSGAALYSNAGSPTINNCFFLTNSATNNGGAIYNNNNVSSILTDCEFTANTSGSSGGAIYNNNTSSPTFNNCTFVRNAAGTNGGALHNNNSATPTLINCSLILNSAANGGAMNSTDASPTLINCIFTANTASSNGGAVRNHTNAIATFINCTLSGNSATTSGGAIRNLNASTTFTNCIIWNNSAAGSTTSNSASIIEDAGSTTTYSHCLIANLYPAGTSNIDGTDTGNDPLFIAPGEFSLQFGSPAIGAGDNSANNQATDIDGNTRIINMIDLGAHESAYPDTTATTQWAATQGLDSSNGDPTDDPDGDQRTNLEEFALDGDPNDASDDGKVRHTIETFEIAETEHDFFILTLPVRDGATFTGTPLSATIDGITYTIEGSLDLQSFDQTVITAPAALSMPALTTGWSYQGFTFVNDTSSQSKGFLKVTISETETPE